MHRYGLKKGIFTVKDGILMAHIDRLLKSEEHKAIIKKQSEG